MNAARRRRWLVVAAIALLALALLLLLRRRDRTTSTTPIAATPRTDAGVIVTTHSDAGPHPAPIRGRAATIALGSIAGTVRTERGVPLAGARVCAGERTSFAPGVGPIRCATSDGGGRYRIDELPRAAYGVIASAAEHEPSAWVSAAGDDRLRLRGGEDRVGVDLWLRGGGGRITGTVLDVSGGPIVGAGVSASQSTMPNWAPAIATLTDDDGHFALDAGDGGWRIDVSAAGYAGATTNALVGGDVTVRLQREATITGIVVRASDGAPVAGAKVTAVTGRDVIPSPVETDADGLFTIGELEPGDYAVVAEADGLSADRFVEVKLALGETSSGIELRLDAGAMVAGRVVYDGAPPRPCTSPSIALTNDEHIVTQAGDDDGVVIVPAVPAGTYKVMVFCGRHTIDAEPVTVDGIHPITNRTWIYPSPTIIAGMVRDASGRPQPGVRVRARRIDHAYDTYFGRQSDLPLDRFDAYEAAATTRTDGDGRFELRRTNQQPIQVVAYDLDRCSALLQLDPAKGVPSPLELVLHDTGTVRGVVTDRAGRPLPDQLVAITPGADVDVATAISSQAQTARTHADGRFAFGALELGTYTVALGDWDYSKLAPTSVRVVNVTGQHPIELRLAIDHEDLTIVGRVIDDHGAAVPYADIYLERQRQLGAVPGALNTSLPARTSSDGDGRFVIDRVAGGPYAVMALAPDGAGGLVGDVAGGAATTITVRRYPTVRGVVRGLPVGGTALVQLWPPDGGDELRAVRCERDGSFELTAIAPASYRVTATTANGSATATVTVAPGVDTSVDLTLTR